MSPSSGSPAPTSAASRPRRLPPWLLPALVLAAAVAMGAVLSWRAISSMSAILLMLLCSLFLALALEPPVDWLVRHRIFGRQMRRGLATGIVMLAVLLLIAGIIALFGQLFVQQLTELINQLVAAWPSLVQWLQQQFDIELDTSLQSMDAGTVKDLVSKYGADVATGVISVGSSLAQVVVSLFGVLLIVFYMVAQGPKLRATICRPLRPSRQKVVLTMWEISQNKISGYINSRIVLAALSTFFTFLFLQFVVRIPYALPLAVFVGVISQFVPTVGTYIAGAAPVLVALTVSPIAALAVLIFIVAYQQVENLAFSPKISSKAMDINPAVAFVSVLAFGAMMGPLGAFLSIPLVASIQAILSTYIHRYELVDSTLLTQDEPRRHDKNGTNGRTPDEEPPDDSGAPGGGGAPISDRWADDGGAAAR